MLSVLGLIWPLVWPLITFICYVNVNMNIFVLGIITQKNSLAHHSKQPQQTWHKYLWCTRERKRKRLSRASPYLCKRKCQNGIGKLKCADRHNSRLQWIRLCFDVFRTQMFSIAQYLRFDDLFLPAKWIKEAFSSTTEPNHVIKHETDVIKAQRRSFHMMICFFSFSNNYFVLWNDCRAVMTTTQFRAMLSRQILAIRLNIEQNNNWNTYKNVDDVILGFSNIVRCDVVLSIDWNSPSESVDWFGWFFPCEFLFRNESILAWIAF